MKEGYLSEDTITALSTATGGAIAIVRISGPLAFQIHEKVIQAQLGLNVQPRKMVLTSIYSEMGVRLDNAVAVQFVHPHSYTGEDLVEYHLHGNQLIALRLIETLLAFGARQALPGEFSFRSVRNGKMSLFQAQAVADLISASNEQAMSLALEKISGPQTHFITELGKNLREIAVLSELGIDFADQDVEELSLHRLKERLHAPMKLLENLRDSYTRGVLLQDGIRVAFVGLPNAGKSSFFNCLLGEDRSIVSDIAGTTRDVISEKFTIRSKATSLSLRLEDTAGLRSTEEIIEKLGIDRTRQAAKNADLVLFIVDPNSQINLIQGEWLLLQKECSDQLSKKTIGILSKSDCVSNNKQMLARHALQELGIKTVVATSAIQGSGISEAIETLINFCENWTKRDTGEILLTRLDHLESVKEAIFHLARGLLINEIDLFASDIRQTLTALNPLIGETLPDDILGKIFSDFCIGK